MRLTLMRQVCYNFCYNLYFFTCNRHDNTANHSNW